MSRTRSQLTALPIPNGWFAVAWSRDVVPGDVRRLLLRDVALRQLDELQAESRRGTDFATYAQTIGWLKTCIEAVGPDAPPDPAAEGELLAWLALRGEVDA